MLDPMMNAFIRDDLKVKVAQLTRLIIIPGEGNANHTAS